MVQIAELKLMLEGDKAAVEARLKEGLAMKEGEMKVLLYPRLCDMT